MIESRVSRLNGKIDQILFSFFQRQAVYLFRRFGLRRTKVSLLWIIVGELAALTYLGVHAYDFVLNDGDITGMVIPVFLVGGYSIVFFRNGLRRVRFVEEQSRVLQQHLMDEGIPYETDLQRQNYAKAALWYPISMILSIASILYQIGENSENIFALVQAGAFIGAINGVYGSRYTLLIEQD